MLNQPGFLGRQLRRFHYLVHLVRIASWTMAELRDDQLGLWALFNVDDDLVATGLFPWEEDVLNPALRAGQDVLVVGCGSGRDVIPLLAAGARVIGVDPSPEALTALKRALDVRGLSATAVQGFIEDVDVPGPFDLIYFSYYCYSYIPERARRIGALKKAARWLKPGGQIVVSAPALDGVSPGYAMLGQLVGRLRGADWRMEPDDTVWFAWGVQGPGHYQHQFRAGALEDELLAAGLTVISRNPDAVLATPR